MKELEKHISEKTEVHAIKPINKELKHVARLKPKRGQKIWEMDLATRIIVQAKYTSSRVDFDSSGNVDLNHTIVVNQNCIYCAAINVLNADKKFAKMLHIQYPKNSKPKPKI